MRNTFLENAFDARRSVRRVPGRVRRGQASRPDGLHKNDQRAIRDYCEESQRDAQHSERQETVGALPFGAMHSHQLDPSNPTTKGSRPFPTCPPPRGKGQTAYKKGCALTRQRQMYKPKRMYDCCICGRGFKLTDLTQLESIHVDPKLSRHVNSTLCEQHLCKGCRRRCPGCRATIPPIQFQTHMRCSVCCAANTNRSSKKRRV